MTPLDEDLAVPIEYRLEVEFNRAEGALLFFWRTKIGRDRISWAVQTNAPEFRHSDSREPAITVSTALLGLEQVDDLIAELTLIRRQLALEERPR